MSSFGDKIYHSIVYFGITSLTKGVFKNIFIATKPTEIKASLSHVNLYYTDFTLCIKY